MDQTTPNGPAKSSWRDRLGLGNKEIPKIADQFKPPGRNGSADPPAKADKAAPVKAAVVAKPAPMAPRAAPATGVKSAQGTTGKPSITPQNGPSLADRLKTQRDAAEKLAEQRVEAARDKVKEPVPAANGGAKPAEAAGRPKFTFAEEEPAKADPKPDTVPPAYRPVFQAKPVPPPVQAPPIIPPRPALGGERPLPPSAAPPGYDVKPRAAPPGFPPPPASGGYRPIDPPGGFPPRSNGAPGRYGAPGGYSDPQLAARRDAYENYRRTAPSSMDNELFRDEPRRARGGLPPPRPRDDDAMGDVFADEAPPPRRRASAKEYRQAYDDYDQGYAQDEGRGSKGPWLILLSMLVLAGIAGGGYWYWDKYLKSPVTAAAPAGEVPVVRAPETPAKTEAEPVAANNGAADPAPAKSKQIYDRILGEQTIDGNQIVPTEEQPVAPDSQTAPKTGSAEGAVDPAAAALPADDTQIEPAGTNQSGAADEPLPLPLPPPPGDTGSQGALPDVPGAQQAALTTKSGIPELASGGASDDGLRLPETPVDAATAADEPAPVEVVKKPVKKAQTAAKAKAKEAAAKARKKAKPAEDDVSGATGPVVLVPPADGGVSDVAGAQVPAEDIAPAPKRTGSLFSGAGNENSVFKKMMREKNGGTARAAAPAAPGASVDTTQVASLEPEPAPAPAKKATPAAPSGGNGYMVQLGSFSSKAEALAEMDRLKARHSGILGGMPVRISEATVAGGTRYRAAVGPANSLGEGNKICSSLFAAGERDCLVRRQ